MIGVRYISLHERSGYAVAAQRIMHGLVRSGVPLTWTPMVPGAGWQLGYEPFRGDSLPGAGDMAPYCNVDIEYDTVILHLVPEYFPRWTEELRATVGNSCLILGHTVWETTRLPAKWPPLLSCVDGLLVPCKWNRQLFSDAKLGVPVELLPHPCLDVPVEGPERSKQGDQIRRFYSINTWTPRKAMDLALAAYLGAFDHGDQVELVIKTSPEDFGRMRGPLARRLLGRYPASSEAAKALLKGHENSKTVRLVTDSLPEKELLRLHEDGDVYISLTRSEGWGIGAFDAATLDVPVIMTGFGGQLDYLGETNQGLVDFDLVPVCEWKGAESYTWDQTWAEPRLAHAISLMRDVRTDLAGWRQNAAELGRRLRSTYARDRVAVDLVDTIAEISRIRKEG